MSKRLESLIGKGFKAVQCKTYLKLSVSRIKVIRNKKEVAVKQIRREVAHLLQTGQESNAQTKVEQVFREENLLATYEILEQYCNLVSHHIAIVEMQKHCPIDLKEAIASILYAAPRCPDLNELKKVHEIFSKKYGSEFLAAATELRPDCGVNLQIAQKLTAQKPSLDVKQSLLKNIAEEHNVEWKPPEPIKAPAPEPIKTPAPRPPQDFPGRQKVQSNASGNQVQEPVSKMPSKPPSVQGNTKPIIVVPSKKHVIDDSLPSQASQQQQQAAAGSTSAKLEAMHGIAMENEYTSPSHVGSVEMKKKKETMEEEEKEERNTDGFDGLTPVFDEIAAAKETYSSTKIPTMFDEKNGIPSKRQEENTSNSFSRRESYPVAPEKKVDPDTAKEDTIPTFDDYPSEDISVQRQRNERTGKDSFNAKKIFTPTLDEYVDDNVNIPRKRDKEKKVDPDTAKEDKIPTFDGYPSEDISIRRQRNERTGKDSFNDKKIFTSTLDEYVDDNVNIPRKRDKEKKGDFSMQGEMDPFLAKDGKMPKFDDYYDKDSEIQLKIWEEERKPEILFQQQDAKQREKVLDDYADPGFNIPEDRYEGENNRTGTKLRCEKVVHEGLEGEVSYQRKVRKPIYQEDVGKSLEEEVSNQRRGRKPMYEEAVDKIPEKKKASYQRKGRKPMSDEESTESDLEEEVSNPRRGREPMYKDVVEKEVSYQRKGRKPMSDEESVQSALDEEVSIPRRGREPMYKDAVEKEVSYQKKGRKPMYEEDNLEGGLEDDVSYQRRGRKPMYEEEVSYRRQGRKPMYEEAADKGREDDLQYPRKGRKPITYEEKVVMGFEEEASYQRKGRMPMYEEDVDKVVKEEVSHRRQGRKSMHEEPAVVDFEEEVPYQRKGRKPIYEETLVKANEEEGSYQRQGRRPMHEDAADKGRKDELSYQRKGRNPLYDESIGIDVEEESSYRTRRRNEGEMNDRRKEVAPIRRNESDDDDIAQKRRNDTSRREKPQFDDAYTNPKEEEGLWAPSCSQRGHANPSESNRKGKQSLAFNFEKPNVDDYSEPEEDVFETKSSGNRYRETLPLRTSKLSEEATAKTKRYENKIGEWSEPDQDEFNAPRAKAKPSHSKEPTKSYQSQQKASTESKRYSHKVQPISPGGRASLRGDYLEDAESFEPRYGNRQEARQTAEVEEDVFYLKPPKGLKLQAEFASKGGKYPRSPPLDEYSHSDLEDSKRNKGKPYSNNSPPHNASPKLMKNYQSEEQKWQSSSMHAESPVDESSGSEGFDLNGVRKNSYRKSFVGYDKRPEAAVNSIPTAISKEDKWDSRPLPDDLSDTEENQSSFESSYRYPIGSKKNQSQQYLSMAYTNSKQSYVSNTNDNSYGSHRQGQTSPPMTKGASYNSTSPRQSFPTATAYQSTTPSYTSYKSPSPKYTSSSIEQGISTSLKSPGKVRPAKNEQMTPKLQWKSSTSEDSEQVAKIEESSESDSQDMQPTRIATKEGKCQERVEKPNITKGKLHDGHISQFSSEISQLYDQKRESSNYTPKGEEQEARVGQFKNDSSILQDRRRKSSKNMLQEEPKISKGKFNDMPSQESTDSSILSDQKRQSLKNESKKKDKKTLVKEQNTSKGNSEDGSSSEESIESGIFVDQKKQSSSDVQKEEKEKARVEKLKNSNEKSPKISKDSTSSNDKVKSTPTNTEVGKQQSSLQNKVFLQEPPASQENDKSNIFRAKLPVDFDDLSNRLKILGSVSKK